jgi:hypothetical protein
VILVGETEGKVRLDDLGWGIVLVGFIKTDVVLDLPVRGKFHYLYRKVCASRSCTFTFYVFFGSHIHDRTLGLNVS